METLRSARRLERLRRDERGQDLVELTIAMPILLLVIFAILEFGNILDSQQAISYLTREGANIASRGATLDEVLDVTMQNGGEIQLDTRGGVVVSRVLIEAAVPTIDQQVASPGYMTVSLIGGPGDVVGTIPGLNLPEGASVHVVELFYDRPTLTPLQAFFTGSLPDVLYDRYVF